MACSPYSRGSNSTSPPSHHSPGQYTVKAEPALHQGLHMGGPQLKIVEQPQERFRFRYESELGGTHGQLAGRSGADRRSFPTVKLDGFNHRATIRCELFTVEEGASNLPPVPHVHTLQGRNCTGGYAEMRVDQENDFTASFQGLGIIHTAKKQMVEKITNRKLDEKKMDMERMNMGKLWNPTEADRQEARDQANRESQRINMNRVCLRFRALYQNPGTMRMEEICQPIFSDAIYNGKSAQTGELKIVQLSEAHSPCTGNKEIWLLVERVRKNDIKVLVFEEDSSHQTIWQDYGRVIKCHHQYAIIFQTPPYRDKEIRSPVRVFIQLERPSDGCVSEPKHFQYTERDQRTTKRMLMPAESGGPSDSKRFYFDSEQGRTPFEVPPTDALMAMLGGGQGEFMQQLRQPPQPPHQQLQQQQLQQQQQQQLQMQRQQQQTQRQPQPPQTQPQQQQQQLQQPMSVMSQGSSVYYPHASPHSVASPYSPESAAASSPQQPYTHYASPQHNPYQMMSPRDPNLATSAAPSTVDEILQGGSGFPAMTTPSDTMGFGQQDQFYGAMDMNAVMGLGDQQESISRQLTDEEMQLILQSLPPEAREGDGVAPPVRTHRAPRGVVRGLGGPGGTATAPAPAPAPAPGAAADSAPADQTADQLAADIARMNLGRGGGGGGGGGGPPGGKDGDKGKKPPRAADTSRPEVQLAYGNADSLYLFAATGDENFLLERFRCLVGMENYDGDNVLHVAAMYGNKKALSSLLEAISGLEDDLRRAMVDSHNANRQTPLHLAVLSGAADSVLLLLSAGAEPDLVDRAGDSSIHLAARRGSVDVLAALLHHLRFSGQTERLLQQANYRGLSPLHVAVQAGHQQAAALLCAAGADVSVPDDTEGRSPLHLAVMARDVAMCRMLLRQGAAVDAATFADVTPLHLACKLADRRLVSLLIAHGADPHRQSVERQPTAGSGTESGEDEPGERDGGAEEEEDQERLNAFLYADMAGDPTLEQILLGRIQVPDDEEEDDAPQEAPAAPSPSPAAAPAAAAAAPLAQAAAAAPVAALAGKKGDMDSGMDSGLGITQELSSACDVTGPISDAEGTGLPGPAVRQLSALLDGDSGPWRTVAELLELDVTTVQRQASPTVYILRCVKKYSNLSLEYLGQVLGSLGLAEAQTVVMNHVRQ